MSRGKYLSLEEARNMGKLNQFAKEHPSRADERFWPLLEAAATGTPIVPQTSSRDASGDCSGTQVRPGTSEDTSD